MKQKEYITVDEVKSICKELNIRDWTAIEDGKVLEDEAKIILNIVNTNGMNIPLEDFCKGLEVELEHGTIFKDANVTNNHPILTGKIVMAHMKEFIEYYKRLEIMELEGDILKAFKNKNLKKFEDLYKRLIKARHIITHSELDFFKELKY